ncbi:MAG: FlgD immunoglobulin-like domain containing protein, partial [Candidatus Eisenbacteria bacterium]|nr:FlgD immunoglobulin-like domain containing protein [Candidatus Eisenbacteria bacterium]
SAPAPNPFTDDTCVRVAIPSGGASRALVVICDIHGRVIRTLHDGAVTEGEMEFEWNGRDDAGRNSPGGVYLVIVESGLTRESRKIVRAR